MSSKSEYKVVLFRQTEQGYDVISPYQLNKTVAKEVYETVLGVVEDHGNQGNRNENPKAEKVIKQLNKEVLELKAKLYAIKEAVRVV